MTISAADHVDLPAIPHGEHVYVCNTGPHHIEVRSAGRALARVRPGRLAVFVQEDEGPLQVG